MWGKFKKYPDKKRTREGSFFFLYKGVISYDTSVICLLIFIAVEVTFTTILL